MGIISETDRVAILGRIEHNLRRRLRHLDLRADELVARPSDDDLASLAGEGMPGAEAAKLYANVRAGEGVRRWLRPGPSDALSAAARLRTPFCRPPWSGGDQSRRIAEDCVSLSRGPQEQLVVLTRFAIAVLLLEEGRPVSVILNDPLVYADDIRLD
ncbi:hypothetical protein ASE88_16820 [Sphingomonas sp. Leaf38]|nr:hypothetical protein ASE88_16820 [Sphingomonas sp. Leaf38]